MRTLFCWLCNAWGGPIVEAVKGSTRKFGRLFTGVLTDLDPSNCKGELRFREVDSKLGDLGFFFDIKFRPMCLSLVWIAVKGSYGGMIMNTCLMVGIWEL